MLKFVAARLRETATELRLEAEHLASPLGVAQQGHEFGLLLLVRAVKVEQGVQRPSCGPDAGMLDEIKRGGVYA